MLNQCLYCLLVCHIYTNVLYYSISEVIKCCNVYLCSCIQHIPFIFNVLGAECGKHTFRN